MKIGIVTNLYPPYTRGGAENVVVRTVEQLLSLGHDVFVVTGQPRSVGRGPTLGTLSVERVYRFFPRNLYFTLDDHAHAWIVRFFWHIIDAFTSYGMRVVEQVMRDERPDVVMTHNLKGLGLKIPQAIQRLGIPHVHMLHDLQFVTPSGLRMFGKEHEPWFSVPALFFYRAICRVRLGKPAIVLSPSQFLIDAHKHGGFFKDIDVRCMPNPSPRPSEVLRDTVRSGPLRMLFIGQLEQHKGVAFLLDALAKYEGNVQVRIIGGGPLRSWVEERAKHDPRIVYLGYTPQEEVLKCIAGVDVVVVPSLCYENSPTVIYEALSSGVPLIASRIGGVGELIQDGKTGILFTPGDEESFLSAVREMDLRKDDFARQTDLMRNSVAPYAIDAYTDRLLTVFTEAIARTLRLR